MEEEANTVVRYHRRLDRTPEKKFGKLPFEEKKLLSALRGAVENCRNKVDEMKDDLSEKEKTIDEERSRRKEAEERLRRSLVDPYGSPEVNSELRHRLPRASTSDPLLDKKEVTESSEEESEVVEKPLTKSRGKRNNTKSSVSPKEMKHGKRKVRRVLNFKQPANSPRTSHDYVDNKSEGEDSFSENEEEEEYVMYCPRESKSSPTRGKVKASPRHSVEYPIFSPSQYLHSLPGTLGYPQGQYPPPMYAPPPLMPWSSMSSVGMAPTSYSPREGQAAAARHRIPMSRSYPLLSGEQAGGLGPNVNVAEGMSHRLLPRASTGLQSSSAFNPDTVPTHPSNAEETTDQAAASSAPQNSAAQKSAVPTELFSQSASSMSSHYALPTSLSGEGRHGIGAGQGSRLSFPPVGHLTHSMPSLSADVIGDVSARETALLREEIGSLKGVNQQLTDKLSQCTQEVETLKLQILTETPKDGTLDSGAAQKFSELMAEVRVAEKRRQDTMDVRVSQAEQDREQLMHDFKSMLLKVNQDKGSGQHQSLRDLSSASESEDSEEDEEILEDIKADHSGPSSPRVNPDAGRVASLKDALKELERRQQRELHIYREELQVVMEQRDQALEQLQTEREINQMQQLRMPARREQILMAKVSALQREKERAENMVRQLRDEQVERHLYVSLHKALFSDNTLNDNQKTDSEDGKLKKEKVDDKVDESRAMTKEDNQLLEELRLANQEKSLLEMRCKELEAACKQEKEEKNKLERLNGVLQRKLIAVTTSGNHQF